MGQRLNTLSNERRKAPGTMVNSLQEVVVQLINAKHAGVFLLIILAGLAGSGLLAHGQGTSASLTGQVTDPAGAAVAGATVTATNAGTGLTLTVKTDNVGTYSLRPLPIGNYTLAIDAAGFDRYLQTGIELTANLAATQDVHLKVGAGKAESIQVTADAELINTTSAELGTTVGEAAISELPLNGRDPSSLVLLAPGTANVMQRGGEGIQSGFSLPTETGASSGGGRQGSTYYMLDGVSNMDNYNDLTAPFPNADATQEFKVITNNFSAMYGFSPGAVVSIATKSGSNAFHGGAFWFVRNNDLNAGDYFVHSVDPLKRNQFGAYTGGPVFKNKLFFFGNYQGTRLVEASNSNQTYTPTAAMLTGDFSGLAATPGVTNLTGPFHTVNGLANQLDTSIASLDSAAVQIANDGLPKAPIGAATSTTQAANGEMYYTSAAVSQSFNEFTGRLDYDLSPSQRLTLRSLTNTMTEPSGDTPGNILSVLNLANWSYDFQERMEYYNDVLEHTWTVNPTTVNTVAVFWNEQSAHNSAPTDDASGKPMCWSRYINVTELPGQCWMEGFAVSGGAGTQINSAINNGNYANVLTEGNVPARYTLSLTTSKGTTLFAAYTFVTASTTGAELVEIDTNNNVDGASGTAYQRGGVSTVQGSFALNLPGVGSSKSQAAFEQDITGQLGLVNNSTTLTGTLDINNGGPIPGLPVNSTSILNAVASNGRGTAQVNVSSSGVSAKFNLVYYQVDSNTELLLDADTNRVANGILIRQF